MATGNAIDINNYQNKTIFWTSEQSSEISNFIDFLPFQHLLHLKSNW